MRLAPETPAVLALALGQLLTYAGVYYAFPALLPDLLAQTGWSKAELAMGPTLSFLVMAVLTPWTGRLVDRGLGGAMLVALPPLAALALALIGFAPGLWAYLALWAVIGLAQAGMLYETCFAFLTRSLAGRARAAITHVTLVAGFAGTLAFPLGHALGRGFGASGALLIFALLIPLLVVPLNLWGVRRIRALTLQEGASPAPEAGQGGLGSAMRRWPFWVIAGLYGTLWLNHAILLTYILVLLAERGADPATAALVAACIGPAQVAGRLILMLFEARIGNDKATILSVGAITLACVVLILSKGQVAGMLLFALLQGAGVGVLSILRPVMIAQTLGRSGFGAISGAIAVAPILATALGPAIGALVIGMGGAGAAYGLSLLLAVIGAGAGIFLAARALADRPDLAP